MLRSASLFLCTALALAGCSGSGSLGSLGSLGGSSGGSLGSIGSLGGGARTTRSTIRQPLVPAGRMSVVQDRRIAARSVSSAELTRTTQGYLLRATGTPPAAGAYNAELVPSGRNGGVLSFTLRMQAQPGMPVTPRQVSAARVLSRAEMAGVTRVQVTSASNTKVLSR